MLVPLFESLKENGIHICLDTNGSIWNEDVEQLLGLTDLVLLDIKQYNAERHRLLTGRSNKQTLRTAEWLNGHKHAMWIRYVLVPGYSDFEEDIRDLGRHMGGYDCVQRVEILPYHKLGVHMEMEYKLEEVKENTPEQLIRAQELFEEYFRNVVVN